MKFVSFIASSMLIALISQHAIMGLPVNITEVEETCSEGFEMIQGQCMPIDSMTTNGEIETSSIYSEKMIIPEEQPVTDLNISDKSGTCPEGMTHGKYGICEEIEPFNTTEAMVELTTDLNESSGGVENIKGCPEGTEPDEQGACQEIKPSKSTKMITNPKVLLNKDGSCPDNYKMIDGRCLYIKLKTNSTSYSGDSRIEENVSTLIQPKTGVDESSKVELVPVLSDNSCPEGTEYSEYGLCQKQARISKSNPRMKSDGSCPDDFELINGKCTYKNSKIQISSVSTTTPKMRMSKSTTRTQDAIDSEEFSTSTSVGEPDAELQSEVTSTPL